MWLFDHSLPARIRKLVQVCMLLSIAFIGVVVGLGEKLHWNLPTWSPRVEDITLILVSLLAFDLFLEHMEINERLSALEASQVQNLLARLPRKRRDIVIGAIRHYIQLYDLVRRSRRGNQEFGKFAKRLLGAQVPGLEALAHGRYAAANESIAQVAARIFSFYNSSFSAASSDDLDFWLSPAKSGAYHAAIKAAMQKHGTVVTRIFVLPASEVLEKGHNLAELLKQHQNEGINWSVSIADFLVDDLLNSKLDFALIDSGKALTFFRESDPRKSEVVFLTPTTQAEIHTQAVIYARLAERCTLCSKSFEAQFITSASRPVRTRFRGGKRKAAHSRNKNGPDLQRWVASTPDEVASHVDMLQTWLREQAR